MIGPPCQQADRELKANTPSRRLPADHTARCALPKLRQAVWQGMEDTRSRWERALNEAVEFDSWGQVEEAVEGYQRLQVAASAEYVENVLQLQMSRRECIGKLAAVLNLRIKELQSYDRNIGVTQMKVLKGYMKTMIVTDAPFPIPNINAESILGVTAVDNLVQPTTHRVSGEDDVTSATNLGGTLRGAPEAVTRGDLTLTVLADKWGFKDATTYVEPRIAVSVCDAHGKLVEAVQETPTAKSAMHQHVSFEQVIHIQTPINKLPNGSAIFFEFKHWKASKKKKSCKAFCILEMDEIKTGPITLEVYKKPANYARTKKPSLLSIKPLYLHLEMTVTKH